MEQHLVRGVLAVTHASVQKIRHSIVPHAQKSQTTVVCLFGQESHLIVNSVIQLVFVLLWQI